MLRGLGAHLEPAMVAQQLEAAAAAAAAAAASDKSSAGDSSPTATKSLAVGSDLVGFSIVADSTRSPTKVDLTAPIELVFRRNHHYNPLAIVNGAANQAAPPTRSGVCVHWETAIR